MGSLCLLFALTRFVFVLYNHSCLRIVQRFHRGCKQDGDFYRKWTENRIM